MNSSTTGRPNECTVDSSTDATVTVTFADQHQVLGGAQGQARDIEIDLVNRLVRKGGEEVHLTPKEYAFLAELARHPGRVFTHSQLLTQVWGPAFDEHIEYARIVVRNLRQKLEDDPASPKLIVNELGVGYRLRGADG